MAKSFEECMNGFLNKHPKLNIFSAKECEDAFLIVTCPRGQAWYDSYECSSFIVMKEDGKDIFVSPVEDAEVIHKFDNVEDLIDPRKPLSKK